MGGMPAAMRIVDNITIPVPGAEGAPIDVILIDEYDKYLMLF